MTRLKRLKKRIEALFRLNPQSICEMSTGERDYHDYSDSTCANPWHFFTHTCKRCGKEFTI